MNEEILIALLFGGGALARVVLPYLKVWLASREPFDWRQIIGQVIGAAIVIIPALTGIVEQLGGAGPAAAVVVGWGAADVGREAQKWYDALRNGRVGG